VTQVFYVAIRTAVYEGDAILTNPDGGGGLYLPAGSPPFQIELQANGVPVQATDFNYIVANEAVATVSPDGLLTTEGSGFTYVCVLDPTNGSFVGDFYLTVAASPY
jgi:hypothetical protein